MSLFRLGEHWSILLDGEWHTHRTEDGYLVLQTDSAVIWSVVYLLENETPYEAIAKFVEEGQLGTTEIAFRENTPIVTHARLAPSSDGYHLFTMNAAGSEMLSLEFWCDDSDLEWAIAAWRNLTYDLPSEFAVERCRCEIPQQLAREASWPVIYDDAAGAYVLCSLDHSRCVQMKFCPWCGKPLSTSQRAS